MVAAVIPAAGTGSRLGGLPKQMRLLGGAPMLFRTTSIFDQHPAISSIVVVAHPDALEATTEILKPLSKPCSVLPGGATRQESVMAGVGAVEEDVSIVLIHDVARPFVLDQVITNVIEAVENTGAAAAAIPIQDTVRYGNEGLFTKTASRDGLYAMQTPQGFRRNLLIKAMHQNSGYPQATDDVALMQRIGQPVRIVEGDPRNIKITTQSDWEWAQNIWTQR